MFFSILSLFSYFFNSWLFSVHILFLSLYDSYDTSFLNDYMILGYYNLHTFLVVSERYAVSIFTVSLI